MRKISLRLQLLSCILLSSVHGSFSSMRVTLGSIEFSNIYELLDPKPTIYFQCQEEKKIILLDVKEKNFKYKFKGSESWQPLAELADKKCKRCGFYELNRKKSDDVFDEWQLCPKDFFHGNYVHSKEKKFNATFTCTKCADTVGSANPNSKSSSGAKKSNLPMAMFLVILTLFVTAAATFVMYNYWKKRKREKNQARFLKLFEESDDINDDLEF